MVQLDEIIGLKRWTVDKIGEKKHQKEKKFIMILKI